MPEYNLGNKWLSFSEGNALDDIFGTGHQRKLELYLEGHRWFDLVRTGRALVTMQAKGMKEYMTVFPVPHSQVQLINNNEIFPQNTGYN